MHNGNFGINKSLEIDYINLIVVNKVRILDMSQYKVWSGDDPDAEDLDFLKTTPSLSKAIKYLIKNEDLDESNSGIKHKVDGYWDEWLDEDDQNIHEHLYMYGGKSSLLKSSEEEDDLDDDAVDDEDDGLEEELNDRLLDVIGGSQRSASSDDDDDIEDEDDDDIEDEDEEDIEE